MGQARHAVKDFINTLCGHLKSLNEYLNQVAKDKQLHTNFELIRKSAEFKSFRNVVMKTKHTGLNAVQAEELFLQTFERIDNSWTAAVENLAKNVIVRVNDIMMDLAKKI